MKNDAPGGRGVSREVLFAVVAAVLWVVLAVHGALRKSPGVDEIPHIGAGWALLKFGDHRMNPEHPPLLKAAAMALPMMLGMCDLPLSNGNMVRASWEDSNQWYFGHELFYGGTKDHRMKLLMARLIPIGFGLLGGLAAWFWGVILAGRRGGLLAFVLLLYYPEYLGHARNVTLDVPTAACGAWVTLAAWWWWRRPDARRGAFFVAAATVGALVKLPVAVMAVFSLALLLVLVLLRRRRNDRPDRPALRRVLLLIGATAVVAFALQWAAAGFRFSLESPDAPEAKARSEYARFDNVGDGLLGRFIRTAHAHRLLPEATLAVLTHTRSFQARNQFLIGEVNHNGWRHYFFVTIAMKTPLAMLAGLIPAAMFLWRNRRGWRLERMLILVLPFAVLFAMHAWSRVSIGHRHILFVYVPWAVLLGSELARWLRRSGSWRIVVVGLVAASVLPTLLVHPHQSTYFNEFVGSPWKARKLLLDSNSDWGQDLPLLADTLREMRIERINLAYYGSGSPEAYGITGYRFILPDFPLAIGMPPHLPPDPLLPTAVSIHNVISVQFFWPGRFEREPIAYCNSIVIFAPEIE